MPRRKPAGGGVTIGFVGSGALDLNEVAETLIVDFIDGRVTEDDPVRWAFILTKDEFTDSLEELAKLSTRANIPYDVLTLPGDKPSRPQQTIQNKASRRYSVEDPTDHMVTYLQDAVDGVVFFLWDEKSEVTLNTTLVKFLNAGIPAFDLTDGLSPLDYPADYEAPAEGEAESEGGETDEEEAEVFSRSDLEGMEMPDLKDIAKDLGITTRYRTPAPLIQAILDVQGEDTTVEPEPDVEEPEVVPEEVPEEPVVPEEPLPEEGVVDTPTVSTTATAEFLEVLGGTLAVALTNAIDYYFIRLDEQQNGTVTVLVEAETEPEPPSEPVPPVSRLRRNRTERTERTEPEPEPEEQPARRRLARHG